MAKVKGPLMSLDAAGRFGKDLLFRRGKTGVHVSRLPDFESVNQASPTEAQATVRENYQAALTAYRALSENDLAYWQGLAAADPRAVNAWNVFFENWTPAPEPSEIQTIRWIGSRPLVLTRLGLADFAAGQQTTFTPADFLV